MADGGQVCARRRLLGCALCTVRAAGALPASLAGLDQLQVLHLDSNWLNGTLPREYAFGFPALEELRLDYNALSVRGAGRAQPPGHAHTWFVHAAPCLEGL